MPFAFAFIIYSAVRFAFCSLHFSFASGVGLLLVSSVLVAFLLLFFPPFFLLEVFLFFQSGRNAYNTHDRLM